jgi:carbon storage regulator
MLVLTRRIDESLVIDDRIIVTVLAVEGDKVKIGITAPREVTILRQELWQAIHEQEQLAEQLSTGPEPSSFEALRKLLESEMADETKKDEGSGGSEKKGK